MDAILLNACLIIEGIAFEVEKTEGINKLLATDLENSGYKASFVLRGQHLDLSVSSFRDPIRELHLLEAVKINNTLLIDEVCCA